MTFVQRFRKATGFEPLPFQRRLATGPWPELLEIPTGLGKTAAVVLAWVHRLLESPAQTPRRLVYCLPMRVLVEQTTRCVRDWLERLARDFEGTGLPAPIVQQLMGGAADLAWVTAPERPAVIVGTQDMLLSRALMRGYGASRYQWPVHFALLHNDALWVFDEVQLMGAGVRTSAQLEGLRRALGTARPARSLWVSATLERGWLDTVDFDVTAASTLTLEAEDEASALVRKRLHASKTIARAPVVVDGASATAKGREAYAQDLAKWVSRRHEELNGQDGSCTIVILNRVERAQALFEALRARESNHETELVLLHGRFRPAERAEIEQRLRAEAPAQGRIVIATQAIEAGVDISARLLITELAPWSSIVQRLGRCNRYGEHAGAHAYWIDVETSDSKGAELALPYPVELLEAARAVLEKCRDGAPARLPRQKLPDLGGLVLRRKDLLELFDTEPDLSGFDIDVSPYVRDTDTTGAWVYWREWGDGVGEPPPLDMAAPAREELCPVSLSQLAAYLGAKVKLGKGRSATTLEQFAWRWDPLGRAWERVRGGDVRPGSTVLLDSRLGGYTPDLGFAPAAQQVVPVVAGTDGESEDYDADPSSRQKRFVELSDHLEHVRSEAAALAGALLGEADGNEVVARRCLEEAARWHDAGKAHPVFQATLCAGLASDDVRRNVLWAKSPHMVRHERPHFRHELASALAWLAAVRGGEVRGWSEVEEALVAYLIAAHHGKVRMTVRSLAGELEPEDGRRFARGVWDGDELPPVACGDTRLFAQPQRLSLDVIELGDAPSARCWLSMSRALLQRLGPFRLAWLEALLRVADVRASVAETREGGDA